MSQSNRILITGASGAIGSALACEYAAPGVTLVLQGRDAGRLEAVAAHCEARGARTLTCAIDVRELDRFTAWLSGICEQETIDLVFVNAGMNINIGPEKQGERWEEVRALVEVNVLGAMATVHAVLPGMRSRRRGQIALISSLAGYYGVPVTPAYSASKAALKAYGEALRGWLAPEGVRINVVMPGFVESPMCRDMPGPKPFLWMADRAARAIRRGVDRDQARISFPFPLNLGCWLLAVLPPAFSGWLLKRLVYGE